MIVQIQSRIFHGEDEWSELDYLIVLQTIPERSHSPINKWEGHVAQSNPHQTLNFPDFKAQTTHQTQVQLSGWKNQINEVIPSLLNPEFGRARGYQTILTLHQGNNSNIQVFYK